MTQTTLQIPQFPTLSAHPIVVDQSEKTWPDWVNVIFGIYLALSPLWTPGTPAGWFVPLGLLITAVTLWALNRPSVRTEWAAIILGALTFLSPGFDGFMEASGAAWTAWVIGVSTMVFAPVAISRGRMPLNG